MQMVSKLGGGKVGAGEDVAAGCAPGAVGCRGLASITREILQAVETTNNAMPARKTLVDHFCIAIRILGILAQMVRREEVAM
jgi:hypothetical protein